ncbi:hypothetical protein PGT21_006666 [Puccinia graminis f. sp. tritici]|uniref:Uncharacterized protein n=1 Tax=Puccinia graminis f. sp. tritici TaxID=56615 RepID=A0A5B0QMJ5_PUCGR|nr:hypothetical protein PGT21_006666 [Puccinia graminis f. sp. tritici]
MDIDAITASTGFTFPLYRAICVKNKLCQCCHKAYDNTHISNRSCPNTEVSMKDKLDLFARLSRDQPATQVSNINVSAVDFDLNPSVQSWDHLGQHSIADLLMFGCDSEGNPLDTGKFPFSISSVEPSNPSFDGSPASSGDVTHCWRGSLIGSDSRLPWLKANKAWVGGPTGQLLFSSSLICSSVSPNLSSPPVLATTASGSPAI